MRVHISLSIAFTTSSSITVLAVIARSAFVIRPPSSCSTIGAREARCPCKMGSLPARQRAA